jgi:hypothetical protein
MLLLYRGCEDELSFQPQRVVPLLSRWDVGLTTWPLPLEVTCGNGGISTSFRNIRRYMDIVWQVSVVVLSY